MLERRKTGRPESGAGRGRETPLAGLSVLLVDDNPDDLASVEIVLRNAGAAVTAVVKVEDALRVLLAGRPDVLVSDLLIPGHDEFTLIRRLRRMEESEPGTPALPALAISSSDTAEQRRYAIEEGFTEFLPKPVHEQVVSVVARLARPPARA